MARRPSTDLQLRAPDPRRDREALFDLIARCFPMPDHAARLAHLREGYIDHSHYDWAASRIGLIGDRIVTHFGVWDYAMRIGRAQVRTGGIGVVCTDADYRGRNLMMQTVEAALQAMVDDGYDMSVLFGIRDFYHRFGYVAAWPEMVYTVRLEDLPAAKAPHGLRRGRYQPSQELAELYNRYAAGLTGTAVRPTYRRHSPRRPRQLHRWGTGDAPEGYAVIEDGDEALICLDAAGEADAILAALARAARRSCHRSIRFRGLHERSALARRLHRLPGSATVYWAPSGGAMIAALNLRAILEKMRPELARRVKGSALARFQGRLTLQGGHQRATVALDGGRIAVADGPVVNSRLRSASHLAQLLIGSRDGDEMLRQGDLQATGDGRILLPILFPAQQPRLAQPDQF